MFHYFEMPQNERHGQSPQTAVKNYQSINSVWNTTHDENKNIKVLWANDLKE